MNIKNWNEINLEFEGADLFLGNGFSLCFSENFNYRNITDFMLKDCSKKTKEVFNKISSVNIEEILSKFEQQDDIYDDEGCVVDKYEIKNEIQKGFIDAIKELHPYPRFISSKLKLNFSNFLDEVNDIYTTNYDIVLYNTIMLCSEKEVGDCFTDNYVFKHKKFNPMCRVSNKVYYLHGALFIYVVNGNVTKLTISTSAKSLIDVIKNEMDSKRYPLIIFEGNSNEKLKAIQDNYYLNFCYNKFKSNETRKLIVFGSSLGESDKHIVDAIENNYEEVAISIYCQNDYVYCQNDYERISKLFKKPKIVFYKSQSLLDYINTLDENDLGDVG